MSSAPPPPLPLSRASEFTDLLRAHYAHSLDPLLLAAPTGETLAANAAACALLGYTEAELCLLGRDGVVDPTDPRLPVLQDEQRRSGRVRGEITMIHKDGRRIPVEVSSVVFRDAAGAERASVLIRDLTERYEARAAERRARLLVEVSTMLTGTLDPDDALGRLAALLAHEIADYAVTYVPLPDGSIRRVGLAHADPARLPDLREMAAWFPLHIDDAVGVGAVVRTGEPLIAFEVADSTLETLAADEVRLRVLKAVEPASCIVVPLRARGHILGALTVTTVRGGRPGYGTDELLLVQELADRAALSIDNARLYATATAELDERRRLDEALRESDKRLRMALDAAELGVWVHDMAADRIHLDARAQREYGAGPVASVEEILARVHPDDQGRLAAGIGAAVDPAVRAGVDTEYRVVGADGAQRWLRVLGRVEFDGDGPAARPLRGLGTVRDVTARLEIDRARRDDEARIARSEELLREVQAIAHLGSWEWDVGTDSITWSDELYRIYGLEPGPVPVSFERYLDRVHPQDRAMVEAAVSGALRTRRSFSFDHRLVRPDGTERYVHGRGRVVVDGDGRPVRMRGSAQDVTDRKMAEEEMRLARDAAERANQAKGQFLAVMSHELRTPLSGIIGYADLLTAGIWGPVSETQQEQIGKIKSGAWHLVSVIEEILAFARLEAGKAELRLEEVDLARLARESADLIAPQACARGLDLRLSLPGSPVAVRTDAGKVRQVLLNLLGNAAKFTESGFVELALGVEGGEAVIHVRDSGPGIPHDARERIFEPFTQLDQSLSRAQEGTGLGLAICRRLARLLGGDVRVEPTSAASGSCFRFAVPA